jgi:hypothetical protein
MSERETEIEKGSERERERDCLKKKEIMKELGKTEK